MFVSRFDALYDYGSLNDPVSSIKRQVSPDVEARLAGLISPIRQVTSAIGDSRLIKTVDFFLETIESWDVGHNATYTVYLPLTDLRAESCFSTVPINCRPVC